MCARRRNASRGQQRDTAVPTTHNMPTPLRIDEKYKMYDSNAYISDAITRSRAKEGGAPKRNEHQRWRMVEKVVVVVVVVVDVGADGVCVGGCCMRHHGVYRTQLEPM